MGCEQLINVPTRFSSNGNTWSLLDHIYTNFNNNVIQTKVLTNHISDHLPVLASINNFNVNQCRNKHTRFKIRNMKNFDKEQFNQDLSHKLMFFSNLENNIMTPNQLWNKFDDIFTETVNIHAPFKVMSRRMQKLSLKPWLTKGIVISIKNKNKIFRKLVKNKSPEFSSRFKIYRNTLTKVKELSKKLYYNRAIHQAKGNSKKLWSTLNNIINFKKPQEKGIDFLVNNDGQPVNNPTKIANCLNNYFVSIADNLIRKSSSNLNSTYVSSIVRNSNSIFLNPVTSTAINSFIKNMDSNKSNSSDSPKTSSLKISAEVISPILFLLINICIKLHS